MTHHRKLPCSGLREIKPRYVPAPGNNPLQPSKSVSALCAIVVALLGAVSSASAANDNLIDALLLDQGGRTSIDTTTYTREPNEPGAGATNGRTAWFVWTAPEGTPASVRLSTYGSSYDTVINLFKRNPANPVTGVASLVAASGAPENPVLVDDDAAISVTQGYVTWTPQAGTTYLVSVGRNGGGGGATTLETTFGPVLAADAVTNAVPNDNLANALEFVATVTTPATQILRGQSIAGTTIAATAEAGEQTLGAASAPKGGTVWYRYRAGATPEVFSVAVANCPAEVVNDIILEAFTNSATPATPGFAQLAFAEENRTSSVTGTPRLVINAAASSDYYFRVTSTDGDGAAFGIRLDFNPTAPANDLIAGAIVLAPALPSIRNQGEDIYSATQTDPTGFNGNTSGANVWYSWKAPASGLVKIRAIAPTVSATTGNVTAPASTFRYDCEVYFDTSGPTDLVFDTATQQSAGGFNDGGTQERSFYAIRNVVYFIEIGGDNNTNNAGRGFFAFAIEDTHVVDAARTGVSYGSEGVLKKLGVPVVNRTGDIAFSAIFELGGPVTPAVDRGLFLFNGATTRAVVVKGAAEYVDNQIDFANFADVFLADRTAGGDTNPDVGFTATLSGGTAANPVTAADNRGFYHDDPANPGVREFRLNDYVSDSFTWNDGAGFLSAFNTPVRENADNTVLVTGTMVGIPITRDTGIFAGTRNVVLQEEDPAPGTSDDVEFGDIAGTPTVNSSDALAFRAILRGTGVTAANDTAIYSVADYNAAPTALNYRVRLRKGLAAAGPAGTTLAGGATLMSLGEPRINSRGRLAAPAGFTPGTGAPAATIANDTAILSDLLTSDGSFAIVARENDLARNAVGQTIAGVKFRSFPTPVLITDTVVVFTATIAGTGVTLTNDTGIWLWDGTSTYLVARKGDPAPGILTPSTTFNVLGTPVANASGRVAFTASLIGPTVTASDDAGLWTVSQDGVTPTLRLRKGDNYDFGRTELPIRRAITSIKLTAGSGGDDGFPRGMDADGNIAVVVTLKKGLLPAGQAVLKIAP